jgi:hypothetical protein
MRPRTPTFIWIPFLFSVEAISWTLLAASLVVIAAVVVTPGLEEVRTAEVQRNDLQATSDLLDQQINLQDKFVATASTDILLMQRLATRQLNLQRKDQMILPLDTDISHRDRSVAGLLAESLTPVTPKPVPPVPWFLSITTAPGLKPLLLMLSLGGLGLSFLMGVRYEKQ